MKLIINIIFLSQLVFLSNSWAQESAQSHKFIAFDTFTLPATLVDQNIQYIQHSMDIVMSDAQFDLTIGKLKNIADITKLSIVIVETKTGFIGEIRIFDSKTKKYSAVVPMQFNTKDESVEKVCIAVTEALLGKKYVMDHLIEIQAKAKIKYHSKSSKLNEVEIANADTKLLSADVKPNEVISPPKKIAAPTRPPAVAVDKLAKVKENNLKKPNDIAPPKIATPEKLKDDEDLANKAAENNKKQEKIQLEKEEPPVPSSLLFDVFLYGGQLVITTEKNVRVVTTIGHVGVGLRVRQVRLNGPRPWTFMAELQIAKPLKRDNYSIPMWRKLEVNGLKKMYSFLNLGGGVEFEPLYFISLPIIGEGLTVIDNNILWAYGIAELTTPQFDNKYSIATKISKSVITFSSTKTKLTGLKANLILHAKFNEKYSFDINFQRSFLQDESNKANNQILSGFVRYQF